MALPLSPTLADMRAFLQARCGFGNQGEASLIERANFDSILELAQEQIWDEIQWQQKHTVVNVAFAAGQVLYDWPDDVAPEWLTRVAVLYGGTWQRLSRGIEYTHDTFTTTGPSFPSRYDFKSDQLEIWPEPDQDYTGRLEHFPRLGRLQQDDDRASVPSRLLRSLALYQAKAHYRQPDAELHLSGYERMKRRFNVGQNTGRRFVTPTRRRPRHRDDADGDTGPVTPRPQMV